MPEGNGGRGTSGRVGHMHVPLRPGRCHQPKDSRASAQHRMPTRPRAKFADSELASDGRADSCAHDCCTDPLSQASPA